MRQIVSVVLIALSLSACRGNSTRHHDTSDNSVAFEASKSYGHPSVDDKFENIIFSNKNNVGFLDIVEKAEIIRLDSSKGLIGRVRRIIVTDDNIVILDENSVFIFDREGSGISRISRLGRGPEDYQQITHMTLTPDNRRIVVYDNYGSKILHFTLDGKFLNSIPIKLRFAGMEYTSSNETVGVTYGLGKQDPEFIGSNDNEDLVYFLNDKFDVNECYLPLRYDKNKFKFITPSLHKFGENVYVSPVYCDTVYVARNNTLKALYHIDIDDIGGEANFADRISDMEFEALIKRSTTFNGNFIDADNCLFICVNTPPERRAEFYIYSKKSGQVYFCEQKLWKAKDMIKSYFAGVKTSYKDKFVSVIDAYRISRVLEKSPDAIPELVGIKYEDNPVVVLYTFKDDL
jgi:hypothetical protein